MAAVSDGRVTALGKNPFTSILINKLSLLLEKYQDRKFTNVELLQRINMQRESSAMLWDGFSRHDYHICLAPLNLTDQEERQISFPDTRENISLTSEIGLREVRLTQGQFENLAQQLPRAFAAARIHPQWMNWVGLRCSKTP